jgi:hypothetical protein
VTRRMMNARPFYPAHHIAAQTGKLTGRILGHGNLHGFSVSYLIPEAGLSDGRGPSVTLAGHTRG